MKFIRSIVASPKNSIYEPSLNIELDLSYITQRVIVCSGPVTGLFRSIYRYPIQNFIKFLNFNHDGGWHLWNFRGEDPGYTSEDVSGKVTFMPFPDHQPPTLEIILESIHGISEFLHENDKNVVVLHCKAGKGRSGTICCAYLMSEEEIDVDTAIKWYTKKRMREYAGDGVSIKSQIRYLNYWSQCLEFPKLLNDSITQKFIVKRIQFIGVAPSLLSSVHKLKFSLNGYRKLSTNKYGVEIINLFTPTISEFHRKGDLIYVIPYKYSLEVSSDIQLLVPEYGYAWVNLTCEAFSQPVGKKTTTIKLSWDDVDGYNGTQQKGYRLFDCLEIECYYNYK